MNRNYIIGVIGLMSAAVIGVFWLQMDLINTAIKENEVKFDKDVFDALNSVVMRLEREEEMEIVNTSFNGFVTRYYNIETQPAKDIAPPPVPSDPTPPAAGILPAERLLTQLWEDIREEDCDCSRCVAERSEKYRSLLTVMQQQGGHRLPLAERVKRDRLRDILRKELANRGINIAYNYGLLSTASNGFVIIDDRYVVESDEPRESLPGFSNIYNSKYRVHLFTDETPAPGLLMLHFPARSGFVGRSVWPNLMGAFIFTGIILFSFGYTIYVIFTQKKLSEMKNDFINNMTHEFKTPIATISLAADSINSPMISGHADKVRRFADIIKQENKRMNSQVEKVLQMALIDRSEFSLNLGEVNLHEVIQQALTNFSIRVEQRQGTVEGKLQASNPVVQGDLTHISNIVNNLLDNADKYSPDSPEITVWTRDANGGVEITVQDKGMGMSKEARKHIFDKFYRVHTGNVHDVKGFGLGLSYVKAIVTAHKGAVDVKSEPGKGSSFTVFLPR
ncbi:MAG: sensor histidine kinase [Saprospiraceae bacterium]|nr:sensor histidine kinase [Saprospiraceae bacterium]